METGYHSRTKIKKDLEEGEVFGYPVESGMGCLMDVDTQNSLNELEQRLYQNKGGDFMGIYEEFFHDYFFDENGAIDQYAFLKPAKEHPEPSLLLKPDMEKDFMPAISLMIKINNP